jgi:hypothetical protein
MKYYLKLFILSSCTFLSCKQKPKKANIDPDLQNIIAACIIKTFGTADSARYYYKLMPIFGNSEFDRSSKRYNDSLTSLLDTAAVYLIVKDSLGHIFPEDRDELANFIQMYRHDFEAADPIVVPDKDSRINQYIDLKELEKNIHFRVRATEENINDEIRLSGRCYFSNIALNKMKTLAAVVLNYHWIRPHIGYGEIFLLQKKNDEWIVIKRQRTWIS